MGGRTSQRKGRSAELELARLLRAAGYLDVRAGEPLNYGKMPDLTGLPNVHCEVKRGEQLRMSEWLEQAQRDAARFGDGLPAVFHRRNRAPWAVTMRLEDWLELYGRAVKGGETSHEESGYKPVGVDGL